MKKPGGLLTIVLIGATLVIALLIVFQMMKGSSQAAAQSAPPAGQGGGQNAGAGTPPGAGQRPPGQMPQDGAARGQQGQSGGGQGAGGQGQGRGEASGQGRQAGQQGGGQTGRQGGQTGQGGAGRGQGGRTATAVRARRVEPGTIENSVVLGGEILANSQTPQYPVMAGKLIELRVKVGDRVTKGQIIARVDPSRPGDTFFPSPVASTIAGTVLSTPLSVGDTVQTGTAICVVGDVSRLRLETFVPERFSVNIRAGLAAQTRFEAIPGETFAAAVDELSPVLDPASRTRRILLSFSDSGDPRIMAGMFASLSLVTQSRENVPVIPRQSLINTYGSWIVYTLEGEGESTVARRREVQTGLENEELVEITAGLEPGERVVVEGQTFLSDGDPVRVVE